MELNYNLSVPPSGANPLGFSHTLSLALLDVVEAPPGDAPTRSASTLSLKFFSARLRPALNAHTTNLIRSGGGEYTHSRSTWHIDWNIVEVCGVPRHQRFSPRIIPLRCGNSTGHCPAGVRSQHFFERFKSLFPPNLHRPKIPANQRSPPVISTALWTT